MIDDLLRQGLVKKLPVTGQEGNGERFRNRISHTIDERKFSPFLRICPSHPCRTEILQIPRMEQPHAVSDLRADLLCIVWIVPGNRIGKFKKD